MRLRSLWIPALAAAFTAALAAPAAGQSPGRGIDPANLDTVCAACQDFYQFANGGWLRRTQIPPSFSRWGAANELGQRNEGVIREVIESAAAESKRVPPGTTGRKGEAADLARIGAFYRSCMDSVGAEREGAAPILPLLARIDALASNAELKRELAALDREAGLAPFGAGPGPDLKDSRVVIAHVGQGGLGLPDRDYYLKDDARSKQIREAYVAHVARMLELAGTPAERARADAGRVLALETGLAAASMGRVQLRDANATYNKMPLAELQRLTPGFAWAEHLAGVGAPRLAEINVRQPAFFRALDSLLTSAPLESWKAHLRFRAVSGAAGALSSAFANEAFRFNALFTGAKEQPPRARRCVLATNAALGEAVGQQYARRTFSERDKARANAMVRNLRAALAERIEGLGWMSAATKREALAKLAAFTQKIGYPDRWRDYSSLAVADGAHLANLRAVADFTRRREWAQVGTPTDRGEWLVNVTSVNAYYNMNYNEVVFPAGILQAPYFDPAADDAVNYGAIGAVIGHEMTHAFDDQGRQFDAAGNLRDWWTADDAARFGAEAQKMVAQFGAYTVVDTATRVNGKLTLGENIADLGGLTIAYHAMQKALAGKPRARVDGFTPEQRFFLGWAQVWRQHVRAEAARSAAQTSVHAPGIWRVNGALANMPEFRAAWGCTEGDAMVRPDALRPRVW